MSVRHPALRTGASLVAGLLIAATLSGAVAAVSPPSARASAGPNTAATPAVAKKKLKFDPQIKYRAAERRVPVNVRSLARKKPTVRPSMTLPRLGRPTGVPGASGSKPSGTGPKVAVAAAPLPADATTNSDGPAKQTGFAGLSESSGPDTNGEPPDPWVAVGPEHVVQAVNLTMRITDRQGADPFDGLAGRLLPAADRSRDVQLGPARHLRQPPWSLAGDRGQLGLRYQLREQLRDRLHRLRGLTDGRPDRHLGP